MEFFTPGHLIPVLIVAAILFFGWKQLPDMARSAGKSLRILKTEMKGMSEDDAAREARKAEHETIEHETIEKAPVPPADKPNPEASKPSAD